MTARIARLRGVLIACVFFPWATLFLPSARAAPVFDIVTLGLTDADHTRSDGYQYSVATQWTDAGHFIGTSMRYRGGESFFNRSVWLYEGASTIDIGLTGGPYISVAGQRHSVALDLNRAGQVIGHSYRFDGIDLWFDYFTAWLYDGANTVDIGLADSGHTSTNGVRNSDVVQLNEAGQAVGWSWQYDGMDHTGRSAWLYDGANTIKIGLTGSEHTDLNGGQYSTAEQLNEAGHVIGESRRVNGNPNLGWSAWLYNGTTTIDIGLTGTEHTRNDGYKLSSPTELNEAGHVLGSSNRYGGGSADLGSSAWLYIGTTSIDIGLTGPEHTRNDGYRSSFATRLNDAGHVLGSSARYGGGSVDLGSSAWIYDGATTIELGLTGGEYTRGDGYERSLSVLGNVGLACGQSERFGAGGASLGTTAWCYDGATTQVVGLTGLEHTRNDGYRSSLVSNLHSSGHVLGISTRFAGNKALGSNTWLYDGETTVQIGLTGSAETRADGYQFSVAFGLNEAGQVFGNSERYVLGSALPGSSAWFYDGQSTSAIGLAGNEHIRSDGFRYIRGDKWNAAEQISGFTRRFSVRTELGQDAWLYDPVLDETIPLRLSAASNGNAFSQVNYLGNDGLVLGTYTLFGAGNTNLGNRAFFFTIADGMHDLGSLIDGGLPANGWDFLANTIRANGVGQILGHGKLTSQSGGQMAYLLTPVPEPAGLALALTALLGLAVVWRRHTGKRG